MKRTIRILMWIHFVYLLCLPTLAVVSAVVLFPREDYWTQLLIIGFPAVVTYCLFLASGYSIPESLPVALALVMAVPLQVAAGVYLFGGGSIWLFFAENAAVEISAFVIGMMTVALPRLRSGSSSFLIVLIAVPCFIGGSLPHIALVFYGYGEASLWLLLFITAFLTAFADHIQSCKKATAAYDKTQRVQNLDMRYEGGPLFKLLRIDPRVPAISPLWNDENKTKLNPRVHVFAWIAIFLPVVVGTIAGVVTVP
jgi:hypothetical protein